MTVRPSEIEDAAALWLSRSVEPAWAPADQAELDAWLEQSMAHKAAFWRLRHAWARADRLSALRSPEAPVVRPPRARVVPWRPAALAATVLFAMVVGGVGLRDFVLSKPRTYATEVGGRETVPLADGSKVELNTDTHLRTQVGASRRNVWLDDGEAYFEVAHDADHPFVVTAGPRRITVLGTRFTVRREGDAVTVAVIDGRVKVEEIHPAKPAPARVITRGDIIVARGPATLVTESSVDRVAATTSWRDGMLTFDQQSLGDVAAEFNRYNRKKLQIDASAAEIRIGGRFQAEDVEAFALLLRQAYGLRVSDDGQKLKISG